MGRRNREFGRHVVWGSGDTTVWRYDDEAAALEHARAAVNVLPQGTVGTPGVERAVRRKKKSDTTSFIPTVTIDEVVYQVVLAADGKTPVSLRVGGRSRTHPPIDLVVEAKA